MSLIYYQSMKEIYKNMNVKQCRKIKTLSQTTLGKTD